MYEAYNVKTDVKKVVYASRSQTKVAVRRKQAVSGVGAGQQHESPAVPAHILYDTPDGPSVVQL